MFQRLLIVGYVGQDAALKYTQSGAAVSTFSVAASEKWTKDNEKHERTVWFRCSMWGKLAESVTDYVTKGTLVLVEGTLVADENGNPRVWTGTDGETRASFEVKVDTLRLLGGKREEF